MSKITKGFLATKKGKLIRVQVSVSEMGFYIKVEGLKKAETKQHFRNTPFRAQLFVDSIAHGLKRDGYEIKDLGDHHIRFDKETGLYLSAL